MKDNSIKKDLGLAAGGVALFYIVLVVANYLDMKFGLTQAFTLVDIASLLLKVSTASAIAWVIKRVVFKNTLGKDFGGVFNEGWEQFTIKEKTKWILGVFVVLFVAILTAA